MTESLWAALRRTGDADDDALKALITCDGAQASSLWSAGEAVRRERYGNAIFTRGLIEFTNICRNNCLYCGLRAANHSVARYRLTADEILACADEGYALGFRTFVLQGGEDGYFDDDRLCAIVREIHRRYPTCAITLSVGERSRASYQRLHEAGASRYLLRHETASVDHYHKLHPPEMSLDRRMRCLWDLKEIGYQVGSGFMVGSPHQTLDNLVMDLRFLQKLQPDMIGIGPFIPQSETPFHAMAPGSLWRTVNLIAILRLMFPYALIPATTALGTIDPRGREMGIAAGANVVMPNLSPIRFRKLYAIYDNKLSIGGESAQCRADLARRMEAIGCTLSDDRGDVRR